MRFELQSWTSEQIQSQIRTPHQEVVDKLSRRMTNPIFQRSWLVQEMQEKGTWPQAPIVLKYERDIPMVNGKSLRAPYNLLEGHHRLAYLNKIIDQGAYHQDRHDIWMIHIPLH